jgi:hypothetical protein
VNIGTEFPDLGTLAAVIAHSQIVVAAPAMDRRPTTEHRSLPAGFGDVDVAVLEWIAAEGRRVGRELARF